MAKKALVTRASRPDLRSLTARQREIFDFLREKIVVRGYAPTVREIGQHFGITSPNGVMCHLKALEKKGLILREATMSRAIQLTEAPVPLAALPLVGNLAAGEPLQPLPEPHPRLEFAGLFASAAHCCLRVIGNGLRDDAILEGDCLVVRRQSDCRDGDLVVVLLDDGRTAVNRHYRESRQVRLESISRTRPPQFADRTTIFGLVVGVIRQY